MIKTEKPVETDVIQKKKNYYLGSLAHGCCCSKGVWAEKEPNSILWIIKDFSFFPLALANQFVF